MWEVSLTLVGADVGAVWGSFGATWASAAAGPGGWGAQTTQAAKLAAAAMALTTATTATYALIGDRDRRRLGRTDPAASDESASPASKSHGSGSAVAGLTPSCALAVSAVRRVEHG